MKLSIQVLQVIPYDFEVDGNRQKFTKVIWGQPEGKGFNVQSTNVQHDVDPNIVTGQVIEIKATLSPKGKIVPQF